MKAHPDIENFFGNILNINDRNRVMAAITLELFPELRVEYKNCPCIQNLYLDEICYEFDPDHFSDIQRELPDIDYGDLSSINVDDLQI
ncbi:hypothetical protein J6A31_05690 [bacterium]|nr:hypothetical protein [bacterium]